jgi:two-component system, NtrC family, response regulator
MTRILVVDDDQIFYSPFISYLSGQGHECHVAENLSAGIKIAQENDYDIVFLDVILPDANSLKSIADFKKCGSSPEIIVVTGKGESSGAELALKNGAWDYLEKPPAYSDIKLIINRVLRYRENKPKIHDLLNRDFIVGRNETLRCCLELISKAAKSDGGVLITGETGTGKELVAKAIHINSKRAKRGFITVDCTNIPVSLVENLLFGHVKGVFTGADKDAEGLIKQADDGTLFLDEIADLPISAQKSLLGTLQSKKFRALGAKQETLCDFRVISATNKDLNKMQADGLFRRDLYYRLVTYHIHLPPLRERLDDIKLLASHYVSKICEEFGIDIKGVSSDFFDTLTLYEWPGNIRELINVLHTTIANAMSEPMIYPHHLPLDIRIHLRKTSLNSQPLQRKLVASATEAVQTAQLPPIKDFRDATESKYLDALIRLSGGDADKMCRIADVSRSGLYKLLGKHGKRLKR